MLFELTYALLIIRDECASQAHSLIGSIFQLQFAHCFQGTFFEYSQLKPLFNDGPREVCHASRSAETIAKRAACHAGSRLPRTPIVAAKRRP